MKTKESRKYEFHIEKGVWHLVRLVLLVILLFLLAKGFCQVETVGKWQGFAAAGSLLVQLFFFYAAGSFFQRFSENTCKKLFTFQCVCVLLLQGFFLFYYRSTYLWDAAFVTGGANSLLEQKMVAGEAYYYLSVYPNQNGFVLFTMVILKLGKFLGLAEGNQILLLNCVNTISIDIGLLFTVQLVKKWRPALPYWKWNQLVLFLFANPFLYVTVSYYYTMTLSLPWFMGFIYFFLTLLTERSMPIKKQACIAVKAGICAAAGFFLRATTVLPVIAAVLIGLLAVWAYRKTAGKKAMISGIAAGAIMLVTALFLTVLLTRAGRNLVGIDTTDTAFPTTHWLMMSLSGEGFHNAEDEAFTAGFLTKEEKERAVKERLVERLKELGFTGCVRQAGKKLSHTFSGGANSYKMFYENALRTDKGYSYLLGEKNQLFMFYAQGYHMLTLLLVLLSVWRKFSWKLFFLQTTMLGGFLFYVLWEAAAQYQIPFLLLLAVLAVEGADYGEKSAAVKSRWMHSGLVGAMGIILLCVFFAVNDKQFVNEKATVSHPIVTQTLANEPVVVRDTFVQSFEAAEPFNYILFQWRNEFGEENDSVYEVTLTGEKTGLVFKELLAGNGETAQGGFEKQFSMLWPAGREKFCLKLEKVQGGKEHHLEFVTYKMGGYDSYPYGEAFLEQGRDLTFLVARKEVRTVTTRGNYTFFLTALFLLFLFLLFCCKIEGNVERKDSSYGS